MVEYYEQFLQWSINNTVSFAVTTIVVQLLLAVMLAEALSRFLIPRDVKLVHRLWCAMAVLALLTIPLHLIWHTAGIPIASKPLPQESSEENRSAEQASENTKLEESDSQSEGLTSNVAEAAEQPEEIESSLAAPENADQAITPNAVARVERIQAVRPQSTSMLWIWLAAIYTAGVMWCLGRILCSYLTLTYGSSKKLAADSVFLSEAAAIARQLELKRMPVVKLSNTVINPFVYGWIKPVLVVPEGFERWSLLERHAVLAHELAHVGRNDFAWTFLSKIAVALYWFHPATWWMDRRFAKSRELATDDCAVNHGLDRNAYAEGLVQVLERLSACKESLMPSSSLAISMSSFDDLCDRVKGVLDGAQGARPAVRWLMRCFVLMVFACVALTSIKFRVAEAQSDVNKSTFEAKEAASNEDTKDEDSGNEPAELEFITAKLDADDNDLLALLLKAEPSPQDTNPNAKRYSFEGVVQDQDGNPVPNATVLLDEYVYATTIMPLTKMYQKMQANPLGRMASIRAKTVTDAQGAYKFENVTLSNKNSSLSMQASIIAVHPDKGVQFEGLFTGNLKVKNRKPLKLSPLTSISLRYETPEGQPVANSIVVLSNLSRVDVDIVEGSLGLLASSIQPIALTDADGRATFQNVPEKCIALCGIKRDKWGENIFRIKTSNFNEPESRPSNFSIPIASSPATVVAQKDFNLVGKITSQEGQPLSGVRVSFSTEMASGMSDEEGRYSIPLRRDQLMRLRNQVTPPGIDVLVLPEGSPQYLAQKLPLSSSFLVGESHEMNIELQRGIPVRGRIIDEEGQPATGISVFGDDVTQLSAKTNKDGTFEIYVTPSVKLLYLVCNDGNYQLPSFRQFLQARQSIPGPNGQRLQRERLPMLFKQINVDLSQGTPVQLQPATVLKQPPIEVVVSLPNGAPAPGAKVVLMDHELIPPMSSFPAMADFEREASDYSEANSIGRVVLKPFGMLTDRATAKIEYRSSTGEPFAAQVPIKAKGEIVSVILTRDGILKGRVLVNDKPIEGAVVSIQDMQPMLSKDGNRSGGYSSRQIATATTDSEGYYSASVADGKNYTVRLASVPGMTERTFSVNAPIVIGNDGVFTVSDMHLKKFPESAAGVVVDHEGNPIEGASIQIGWYDQTVHSWIGFKDQSQLVTDHEGRFSLKNIPPGTHEISVNIHKNGAWTNAMQKIQAGDQNIRIVLNYRPTPPMKRLEPKSVTPIQR